MIDLGELKAHIVELLFGVHDALLQQHTTNLKARPCTTRFEPLHEITSTMTSSRTSSSMFSVTVVSCPDSHAT